jgi:recombination protein RecT
MNMPDNASAPQGTAVATRDNSPVAQFQRQLEDRARDIQMALPGHITPDKFQRTVLTAVAQNADLLKADRGSLILSCYKAAQDGLLPDGREAALVTFNTRFKDPADGQWKSKKLVQYMPMVYGLRKKILQSAEVVSLEVNVVYRAEVANGTFLYEVGLEPPLRHRPSLELTAEETSDNQIVAAYSIATMKDGTKSYEIMRRFEIDKVRQVSQTGATGRTDRQGKPIEPKGPWVDWFAEMAKKTVMRRHAKTLPMSGDVLIDVEGHELERNVSSVAALGSAMPDEPTAIEDHTAEEPEHDPETGEIIESDANATADETAGARVVETAKAEPEKKPARQQREAAPQPESEREPTLGEQIGLDEPPGAGEAEHPAAPKAREIIAEIEAANAIIDVNSIVSRHKVDIEAMPGEIGASVEIAADKRKNAIKAEREPSQQAFAE